MTPAKHVRANVTSDGLILMDIENGSIFSANVVGARIWQLLREGRLEEQITDAIAEEWGVPRDTVASDVIEFVQSLRERALVTN
jgi:hypothetical protein